MQRIQIVTALLIGVTALVACAGAEPPEPVATTPSQPAGPLVLGCDERAEPSPPSRFRSGETRLSWKKESLRVMAVTGKPTEISVDGETRWLWKMPIAVTAETVAEVRLTSARSTIWFAASNDPQTQADLRTVVRVEGCPSDTAAFSGTGTVGPVTGYAAAVVTKRDSCGRVYLRARVDGALRTKAVKGKETCALTR